MTDESRRAFEAWYTTTMLLSSPTARETWYAAWAARDAEVAELTRKVDVLTTGLVDIVHTILEEGDDDDDV